MAPPSLLTSFTDALPFLNSSGQEPLKILPLEQTTDLKETTSTGPTFDSYLHILNSNGWLERDRSNLVEVSAKSEVPSDPLPSTPRLPTSATLFRIDIL